MSDIELRIDVYSHNVMVSQLTKRAKIIIMEYCLTLGENEVIRRQRYDKATGRLIVYYERQLKRIYAAATVDRSEFRFHINIYHELIQHLAYHGLHEENMDIMHHEIPEPVKIELDFIDKREPREDQVPAIEYLSSNKYSKVLTSQTGFGKTFCANSAINLTRERTLIIVKGMYVKRWLDDLNSCFKFKKGELMVVRGSSDLITLIELAQHKLLDAKIIIITNTTFRMFIDDYELKKSNNMYGCNPIDFFKIIGAGIRLIDEVHQDFHLNFKIDLYTNIKTCINLTATLKSDNKFINKMYDIMFPVSIRPNEFEYDKYIAVKAYIYHLIEPRKVKYKQRGRTSYSHIVYEESIMNNAQMRKNYMNMIVDIIQNSFIPDFKPGQRMMIFCGTIEFCILLTTHLKNMFHEYDVNKYNSGDDDYSVMERSDIIVSTLKSAGTAVDIPGLKLTLMTVAVGSRQANEQAVGRLRRLKQWPEVTPEFIYLVCQDVESHLRYHYHKQEVLSDKILSFKEYITPYKV